MCVCVCMFACVSTVSLIGVSAVWTAAMALGGRGDNCASDSFISNVEERVSQHSYGDISIAYVHALK